MFFLFDHDLIRWFLDCFNCTCKSFKLRIISSLIFDCKVYKPSPKRINIKCPHVTDNNQGNPCSRETNIHSSDICEESQSWFFFRFVSPNSRKNDNIFFTSLEAINRVNLNLGFQGSIILCNSFSEFLNLFRVRRNNS